MSTDDRFLPQGKQILPKICQVRPMPNCGAVVKEFLARADKPGSTPGEAAFCFFLQIFFSLFGLSFF